MTNLYKPYDANSSLGRCTCGAHASQADHDAEAALKARGTNPDTLSQDFVEAALVKALFPQDGMRRRFLQAVGATTAQAAIALRQHGFTGSIMMVSRDRDPPIG